MKYRKTGIAIALPFWVMAILQMLYFLYPQTYAAWKSYQPYGDVVCILLVLLVYRWQRKTYQKKGYCESFELHGGHVFGIIGAAMKILAEGFGNLPTTALLLSAAALLLLLISLLLLLRFDSYADTMHE